ncbi:hypothetical protein [Synechococcus sp. Cruz CV-v-12]|uniref:hypothetical protein n=1 Tax=Synechococcus sp. Cruz CV-v-12 TaxID=2823728 RepID=UPI0020CFBD36|nr:hypothetical protein [Synechococcus sp. Cruz CV-v-12]
MKPWLLAPWSILIVLTGSALLAGRPAQTMGSPWWENYDTRESFLCRDNNKVVLERNDAQAALISGRSSTTLFREPSDLPGLRYGNDALRLILRGDELTLERLPQRVLCLRTDQV